MLFSEYLKIRNTVQECFYLVEVHSFKECLKVPAGNFWNAVVQNINHFSVYINVYIRQKSVEVLEGKYFFCEITKGPKEDTH